MICQCKFKMPLNSTRRSTGSSSRASFILLAWWNIALLIRHWSLTMLIWPARISSADENLHRLGWLNWNWTIWLKLAWSMHCFMLPTIECQNKPACACRCWLYPLYSIYVPQQFVTLPLSDSLLGLTASLVHLRTASTHPFPSKMPACVCNASMIADSDLFSSHGCS